MTKLNPTKYKHNLDSLSYEYQRMIYICKKYKITIEEYCLNKDKYEKTVKVKKHTKHGLKKSDKGYYNMMYAISKYGITVREYCKNKDKYPTGNYPNSEHFGFSTQSKEYAKSCDLKRTYNITLKDYNNMLLAQNGVCDICKNTEKKKDKRGNLVKLSVDHCHITNKIRGLLCSNCNHGLGHFKDNVNYMKTAIKYLENTLAFEINF